MSKPTEYDKLRALWYEKLKAEGFSDIESTDGNLRSWSSKVAIRNSYEDCQTKSEYYSMASKFLHDYTFDSAIEKVIWEYHANGISVRDITETLNKAKVLPLPAGKSSVWVLINKLERKMKAMYMPDYTKRIDE